MGFPWEWELQFNKHGNGNGNGSNAGREWEWLNSTGSHEIPIFSLYVFSVWPCGFNSSLYSTHYMMPLND